jgi:hypothetical protein
MVSLFSLTIYILSAAIGFMMGFLYKNAKSNNLVVNPDPAKTYRLFLNVFVIGVVALGALSYFTVRALKPAAIAEDSAIKFRDIKQVLIFFLTLFFMGLTIIANYHALSIKRVRPLPYLLIVCFYAVFILIDVHYISPHFADWQYTNHLLTGDMPDYRATGWIKCGLGFAVTAFNAFMMWWAITTKV